LDQRSKQAGVTAMLQILKTAYAWRTIEPGEVKLYVDELQDYSALELELAARTWVRSQPRFPAISDIIALIDQRRRQPSRWEAPQLPPGGLVQQDEVKQAVDKLLSSWGISRRKPEREPGSDDGGPEAA
jgi:hypothetical protein